MDLHRLFAKRSQYVKDVVRVFGKESRAVTVKHVGPAAQFLRAWNLLEVEVHDDLKLTDRTGFTFSFLHAEKEWLKEKVARLARDKLFKDLANRTAETGGRRDLKGIT
jgi:hypothetical protein